MERSIRYNFLESVQRKLSSDYILNIYFSRAVFPILMAHHFLRTNPYKMSIFQRSITCSFFRNCTQILTRTQGKKFEDMFLVKVASKGTSLNRLWSSPVFFKHYIRFGAGSPVNKIKTIKLTF